MYIHKKNTYSNDLNLSLREMIKKFMDDNNILESALAEEIGIHKKTLSSFLTDKSDLKFLQALRFMKLLNLTESELVSAYYKDMKSEDTSSLEKVEKLSYIMHNFDVQTLKDIGIIKTRAKVDELEEIICHFFGFKEIYEYDDTSLTPALFSKSKMRLSQEKEAKMTTFWLKCAIQTFNKIGNPNEYNKEILLHLLKRVAEFTLDEVNGYNKFILVLYQLGVTVVTQSYIPRTNSFGVTMILNNKPCIVITDRNKKYHKLWITLLHELYHVINDYDLLESIDYHLSNEETHDIFLNESKADKFALDVLVNPAIQSQIGKIISFPQKVKLLANELGVSESIIYGVYSESLPKGDAKNQAFRKYNQYLITSETATRNILFDVKEQKTLVAAINKLKEQLVKKAI